jgi:hypothetical protein
MFTIVVPESPSKLLTSNIKAVPVYKGPAPESRWDQYDTLHVFTAKGLEYRKKVEKIFDVYKSHELFFMLILTHFWSYLGSQSTLPALLDT